jgi:hypothetical protein
MSNDQPTYTPAAWPMVVAVTGVFAIFFVIMHLAQTPVTPLTEAVNVPEDQQWKLTNEGRKERLKELKATAAANASSYGWINRDAGVVRLPVDRAIELTLAEINHGR